jgi:hypothetical protein
VVGSKTPFSPEQLKRLYPTHADYVANMQQTVQRAVAGRWITPEDAPAILAHAAAQSMP